MLSRCLLRRGHLLTPSQHLLKARSFHTTSQLLLERRKFKVPRREDAEERQRNIEEAIKHVKRSRGEEIEEEEDLLEDMEVKDEKLDVGKIPKDSPGKFFSNSFEQSGDDELDDPEWHWDDVKDRLGDDMEKYFMDVTPRDMEANEEKNKPIDYYKANSDMGDFLALPKSDQFILKKFGFRLELAKANPKKYAKHVHRIFLLIFQNTQMASVLNDEAWDDLWELETQDVPLPRRLLLANLQVRVGANMKEKHLQGFVEAMFWHDDRDKAFDLWERIAKDSKSLDWWNIGVRMFATENNPDMAMEVANDIVQRLGVANVMTYMPVIISYHTLAELESETDPKSNKGTYYNKQAIKAYQTLKKKVQLKHREFLRIANSFLDAGYIPQALMVYEDLVDAHPDALDKIAISEFDVLINNVLGTPDSFANAEDLHKHLERTMRILPITERNKVLCQNWVRSLAKIGRVDSAMRVMEELRILNNVNVNVDGYNAILEGLKLNKRYKDCDELGGRMIKLQLERMMAQKMEEMPASVLDDLKKIETQPISNPKVKQETEATREKPDENLLQQTLITATTADIATFSILFQMHSRLGHLAKLSALQRLMGNCGIRANSYIINHVLWTLLKKKKYSEIWKAYEMTNTGAGQGMTSSHETFRVLWKAMRHVILKPATRKTRYKFPSPRELFREMMSQNIKPNRLVYNTIVKCFFHSGDIYGGFMTIDIGNEEWNIPPGKVSVGNLVRGLAKVRAGTKSTRERERILITTRERAAKYIGKWAGPARRKPGLSYRQRRWLWKKWRDEAWPHMKNMPIEQRPYYKYAAYDYTKGKLDQDHNEPDKDVLRRLGNLMYGDDDLVPDAEEFLSKTKNFLIDELESFNEGGDVQTTLVSGLRAARIEMGLDERSKL